MSVDPSKASALAASAREALAEIRASQAELQTLLAGAFDRLGNLVDGLPALETERPTRPATSQSQIEQLAAVAAELTALAAEQKRLLAERESH
jgi:hypothetical protein